MTPKYEWNKDQPTPTNVPEQKDIEESVWYAIDIQPSLREIKPTITTVYLRYNLMNTGVEGTARNEADEPLVAFKYSWSAKRGMAVLFDDPNKSEYLNF